MFDTTPLTEKPTTRLYIPSILEMDDCPSHSAAKGEPCWVLESSTALNTYPAICHKRVLKAGERIRTDDLASTARRGRSRGRYQRKARTLENGLPG